MSEFYESLNAMLNQKGSKMAKSKAALQKVIADLNKRGEKVLAMELEKEMKSMDDGDEGKEAKAGQDSGVDQVAYSGDKADDAATMMEEEAANPAPVVEEQDAELTLAISQVEKLLKFGLCFQEERSNVSAVGADSGARTDSRLRGLLRWQCWQEERSPEVIEADEPANTVLEVCAHLNTGTVL